MKRRPALSIIGLAVLLAVSAVDLGALPIDSEAPREARITRRDLREARAALKSGQLDEAAAGFERILDSDLARDPAIRNEALYATALVLLSNPDESGSLESATARIAALRASARTEMALEVEAMNTLVAALVEARQKLSTSATEKVQRATDHQAEMSALAEQLHSEQATIERLRRRIQDLESDLDASEQQVSDLLSTVSAREHELAQNRADIDFLTTQLEARHQDQARMLAAVMKKNEELKATERQLAALRTRLERQGKELDDQADVLATKEEALRKREEAIREVTDRILKKEEPDS